MISPTQTPKAAHIDGAGQVHLLEDHLAATGVLAAAFAPFSPSWAELAGRWHDLGKYANAFQQMIYSANGMEAHIEGSADGPRDHSTAGAVHAFKKFKEAALPLAFVIAGHHGGLSDLSDLKNRLDQKGFCLDLAMAGKPPDSVLEGQPPPMPMTRSGKEGRRALEFWIRLLFSCLIDADRLDTERFFNPDRADKRDRFAGLPELKSRLDSCLNAFQTCPTSPVNSVRADVLSSCRAAASWEPGAFSLTVPTGGGKTYASMAFALDHAIAHGKRRVVVVAPYMSLVEQTATALRNALGEDQVVEHYSASDPKKETHESLLASENWAAPVIVTTTVQFFESMFGNKPRACRKLHNLVNSVVILDEAQSLPVGLMEPLVDGLRLLVEDYGVSLVLSTATQPALGSAKIPTRLRSIREIVPDHARHFSAMRRVRVQWRAEPTPLSTIAGELAREEDALVIVHRRDDAAELLKFVDAALGNSQTFHLSALMCPAHRREVIEKIKNEPARRVVATQLVEAGMDLDFAVVYRAMGGIDSMAQAAGRCNREGKRDRGDVCIFLAESNPPKGLPVKGLQTTRRMLRGNPNLDLLDPRTYETYFRNLYSDCSLDEKSVQHERYLWNFKTVSERVALIEDDRAALFIPYGDGEPLLKSLLSDGPRRSTLRAMQQFIVQVPEKALLGWEQSGIVRRDSTGMVAYLPLEFMAAYDCRLGLVQERIGVISASGLVA